jgi:hypothetical protein
MDLHALMEAGENERFFRGQVMNATSVGFYFVDGKK